MFVFKELKWFSNGKLKIDERNVLANIVHTRDEFGVRIYEPEYSLRVQIPVTMTRGCFHHNDLNSFCVG